MIDTIDAKFSKYGKPEISARKNFEGDTSIAITIWFSDLSLYQPAFKYSFCINDKNKSTFKFLLEDAIAKIDGGLQEYLKNTSVK